MTDTTSTDVAGLLLRHRTELETLLRREAGSILAFEELSDLLQGVSERALSRAHSFDWRGPEAALGWLRTLARSFLQDRREHWSALKRRPAALLRITLADEAAELRQRTPEPGPATFAERREALVLAVRALDLLLPRDRQLVLATLAGQSNEELGTALALPPESAARARLRALERLRKAWHLLAGT